MPPEPAARPSRRAVLGGLLATVALGGCTSDDGNGPGSGDRAAPDPDLALADQVRADKRELLARCAAVTARFGTLADRVRPLRADHEAHLLALTAAGPAGGFDATPTPTPSARAVPDDRGRALAWLARAEAAAADRRIGQCVAARDRDLARLIAAIGGCEASHASLLTGSDS